MAIDRSNQINSKKKEPTKKKSEENNTKSIKHSIKKTAETKSTIEEKIKNESSNTENIKARTRKTGYIRLSNNDVPNYESEYLKENNNIRQLIIDTSIEGCTRIAKIEIKERKNKLVTFIEEFDNEENIQSNIYLGEVIKIDKSNNSVFLSYEPGKICFLNIKEFTKRNPSQEIIESIKISDRFIVQMVRERKNHKHPKVTTNVMMYGLYSNLMAECEFDVIYQNNSLNGSSLYEFLREQNFIKDCRVLMKQSPIQINRSLLVDDLKYMFRLWQHIKSIASNKKEIGLLHFEPNIQRMIRAIIDKKVQSIIVSQEDVYQRIKSMPFLLNNIQSKNIQLHSSQTNVFIYYDLQKDINSIDKLVVSNNGIRINFHKTDAIVTIDVDYSSRGSNSKNMDLLTVNKMAANMIVDEIIKKNLGGSLMVDFINMYDSFEYHNNLMHYIKQLLTVNELKCSIYNIKQLGFVFFCLPYNKYDIFNRIYEFCDLCHFGVIKRKLYSTLNSIYLLKSFISAPCTFHEEGISASPTKITINKDLYNAIYKDNSQIMVDLANSGVIIEIL